MVLCVCVCVCVCACMHACVSQDGLYTCVVVGGGALVEMATELEDGLLT